MITFQDDLSRLARFTCEQLDAFSVFVFLPAKGVGPLGGVTLEAGRDPHDRSRTIRLENSISGPSSPAAAVQRRYLELQGLSSQSSSVNTGARIQVGHGLLGWVAHHGRSIHVAPFELDSSSLGIYGTKEPLKSLLAVPIAMGANSSGVADLWGILACDSVKSSAFTKAQGRFLEDIAVEISRLSHWASVQDTSTHNSSWEQFRGRVDELSRAIGEDAVDLLRLRPTNIEDIEREIGCAAVVQLQDQFLRLAQQSVPPHFPVFRVPCGDILLLVDNMMSTFFQNKLRTLADHVTTASGTRKVEIQISVASSRNLRTRKFDLDALIRMSLDASKKLEPTKTDSSRTDTVRVANGGIVRRSDRL